MKKRILYIDAANKFWVKQQSCSLMPSDIALYFYLLNSCNNGRWMNPFTLRTPKITGDIGMSDDTINKAKRNLKNAGLLDFDTKKGSKNTTFFLTNIPKKTAGFEGDGEGEDAKPPTNLRQTSDKPPTELPKKTAGLKNTPYIIKEDTNKEEVKREKAPSSLVLDEMSDFEFPLEEKETPPNSVPPPSLVFPFTSEPFMAVWKVFAAMRKQKKKPIESKQAMLMDLSQFDEEFSIILLKKAIAGDYQGLVFLDTQESFQRYLKQKNVNAQTSTPKPGSREERDAKVRNELAGYYAEYENGAGNSQ
jgi:hypothetical protein